MTRNPPRQTTGTFTGTVESMPEYRATVRLIEVEVDFRVEPDGEVTFLAARKDDEEIPVDRFSRSSLLRAYAKFRGFRL